MHELGIVFHIIKSLEDIAKENDVDKITKVTLELGEVSGVVPQYLTDCWQWAAAKNPLVEGAPMDVETIDAITMCEDCGKTYGTVKYGRTCPHCQSERTHLVVGNEVNIKEIEVAE